MHVSVLFMCCILAGRKNSPSNNDHKSNTFSRKLSTAVSYLQSFLLQHCKDAQLAAAASRELSHVRVWLQSSMVVLTTVAFVPQGA